MVVIDIYFLECQRGAAMECAIEPSMAGLALQETGQDVGNRELPYQFIATQLTRGKPHLVVLGSGESAMEETVA